MRKVPGSRVLAIAQRGFSRDISTEYKKLADQLRGIYLRASGEGGIIPKRNEASVLRSAGDAVQRMFVGIDGRSAFADDGVTALAPYPQILNKWYVFVAKSVVTAHHDWMKRSIPEDVFNFLSNVRSVSPIGEMDNPYLRRPGETDTDFVQRLDKVRLYSPPPTYDSMHTWVDPRGYRLSDRIWDVSLRTRRRIDAITAELIRNGTSATEISNRVERFLLPNRAPLRTNKPYGRDASFDGMRLGRTELSRAFNEITLVASRTNPYVSGIDWALSAMHPRIDICDSLATIDKGGSRIREPYTFDNARIPPAHPLCLCGSRPFTSLDAATVTAQLRAIMQDARAEAMQPVMTPAQRDNFLIFLLGAILLAQFPGQQ